MRTLATRMLREQAARAARNAAKRMTHAAVVSQVLRDAERAAKTVRFLEWAHVREHGVGYTDYERAELTARLATLHGLAELRATLEAM